jgi:hypothetical protein
VDGRDKHGHDDEEETLLLAVPLPFRWAALARQIGEIVRDLAPTLGPFRLLQANTARRALPRDPFSVSPVNLSHQSGESPNLFVHHGR